MTQIILHADSQKNKKKHAQAIEAIERGKWVVLNMNVAWSVLSGLWRPFRAPISSNLISLKSSRCLIFTSSGLVRFGVMVTKKSHLEERRCNAEILQYFSWKIHFSQSLTSIVKPFLWEVLETLYFNLVQMDCPNCYLVGTTVFLFYFFSW